LGGGSQRFNFTLTPIIMLKHWVLRPKGLKDKMRLKKYSAVILILVLLVLPRVLVAKQLKSEWEPVNYGQVMALAADADTQRFPNGDVVDLARKTFVRYQADGRYEEYYEIYAKILTEKGRRQFRNVSSSFTIPYNETEFKVVEVIRPGGQRIAVDLKRNSRVTVEQSQMATNIYNPNSRILSVTLPDVQIGDIVHFIMYDRFARVRVPGTFSDFVTFEGENPIIRAEYTLAAPRDLSLKSIAIKSEIKGSIRFDQEKINIGIEYGQRYSRKAATRSDIQNLLSGFGLPKKGKTKRVQEMPLFKLIHVFPTDHIDFGIPLFIQWLECGEFFPLVFRNVREVLSQKLNHLIILVLLVSDSKSSNSSAVLSLPK